MTTIDTSTIFPGSSYKLGMYATNKDGSFAGGYFYSNADGLMFEATPVFATDLFEIKLRTSYITNHDKTFSSIKIPGQYSVGQIPYIIEGWLASQKLRKPIGTYDYYFDMTKYDTFELIVTENIRGHMGVNTFSIHEAPKSTDCFPAPDQFLLKSEKYQIPVMTQIVFNGRPQSSILFIRVQRWVDEGNFDGAWAFYLSRKSDDGSSHCDHMYNTGIGVSKLVQYSPHLTKDKDGKVHCECGTDLYKFCDISLFEEVFWWQCPGCQKKFTTESILNTLSVHQPQKHELLQPKDPLPWMDETEDGLF